MTLTIKVLNSPDPFNPLKEVVFTESVNSETNEVVARSLIGFRNRLFNPSNALKFLNFDFSFIQLTEEMEKEEFPAALIRIIKQFTTKLFPSSFADIQERRNAVVPLVKPLYDAHKNRTAANASVVTHVPAQQPGLDDEMSLAEAYLNHLSIEDGLKAQDFPFLTLKNFIDLCLIDIVSKLVESLNLHSSTLPVNESKILVAFLTQKEKISESFDLILKLPVFTKTANPYLKRVKILACLAKLRQCQELLLVENSSDPATPEQIRHVAELNLSILNFLDYFKTIVSKKNADYLIRKEVDNTTRYWPKSKLKKITVRQFQLYSEISDLLSIFSNSLKRLQAACNVREWATLQSVKDNVSLLTTRISEKTAYQDAFSFTLLDRAVPEVYAVKHAALVTKKWTLITELTNTIIMVLEEIILSDISDSTLNKIQLFDFILHIASFIETCIEKDRSTNAFKLFLKNHPDYFSSPILKTFFERLKENLIRCANESAQKLTEYKISNLLEIDRKLYIEQEHSEDFFGLVQELKSSIMASAIMLMQKSQKPNELNYTSAKDLLLISLMSFYVIFKNSANYLELSGIEFTSAEITLPPNHAQEQRFELSDMKNCGFLTAGKDFDEIAELGKSLILFIDSISVLFNPIFQRQMEPLTASSSTSALTPVPLTDEELIALFPSPIADAEEEEEDYHTLATVPTRSLQPPATHEEDASNEELSLTELTLPTCAIPPSHFFARLHVKILGSKYLEKAQIFCKRPSLPSRTAKFDMCHNLMHWQWSYEIFNTLSHTQDVANQSLRTVAALMVNYSYLAFEKKYDMEKDVQIHGLRAHSHKTTGFDVENDYGNDFFRYPNEKQRWFRRRLPLGLRITLEQEHLVEDSQRLLLLALNDLREMCTDNAIEVLLSTLEGKVRGNSAIEYPTSQEAAFNAAEIDRFNIVKSRLQRVLQQMPLINNPTLFDCKMHLNRLATSVDLILRFPTQRFLSFHSLLVAYSIQYTIELMGSSLSFITRGRELLGHDFTFFQVLLNLFGPLNDEDKEFVMSLNVKKGAEYPFKTFISHKGNVVQSLIDLDNAYQASLVATYKQEECAIPEYQSISAHDRYMTLLNKLERAAAIIESMSRLFPAQQ